MKASVSFRIQVKIIFSLKNIEGRNKKKIQKGNFVFLEGLKS